MRPRKYTNINTATSGYFSQMETNTIVAAASAEAASHQTDHQEGDRPILFLFPGSVGLGPSMAAFALAMGHVARVIPIRYPDLRCMLEGQNTFKAIAAAAVEQIATVQPSGDVRLLGSSFGGAVAFDVARQMLAAGRSVQFLGILDTNLLGERRSYWRLLTRTFHRIRTNYVSASRMACRALAKIAVKLRLEVQLGSLADRHTRGRFRTTSFRIKIELQEVLRARAFSRWLSQPKPTLPIAGTLFRCHREPEVARTLGWDRLFARLDVIPIAGGHYNYYKLPHV